MEFPTCHAFELHVKVLALLQASFSAPNILSPLEVLGELTSFIFVRNLSIDGLLLVCMFLLAFEVLKLFKYLLQF